MELSEMSIEQPAAGKWYTKSLLCVDCGHINFDDSHNCLVICVENQKSMDEKEKEEAEQPWEQRNALPYFKYTYIYEYRTGVDRYIQ